MTSLVTEKATKKNVWQMPESSPFLQRDLVLDNGHLLVQVLQRRSILQREAHMELGIISRTQCCWNLQKAGSLFSVQRHPCPGESSKQGTWKTVNTLHCRLFKTFFRIIISSNQLSIYGAVANICEEIEAHQDGLGEPELLMGQSIVLGEIEAETPLQKEIFSNHQILWQHYMERMESLSPESKVSRFFMEAGFMHVVEVGQCFMTKDTGDFSTISFSGLS